MTVALTADAIQAFLQESAPHLCQRPIDLSKELRRREFAWIHFLLENGLQEMFSSQTADIGAERDNKDAAGRIYLYKHDIGQNYLQDNVNWDKQKKMSIKLILKEQNGCFKLKNSRHDQGEQVMRRQTWKGTGWRRQEYKLYKRSRLVTTGPHGVGETIQWSVVPFPTLLHYFPRSEADISRSGNRKQSPRVKSEPQIIGRSFNVPPSVMQHKSMPIDISWAPRSNTSGIEPMDLSEPTGFTNVPSWNGQNNQMAPDLQVYDYLSPQLSAPQQLVLSSAPVYGAPIDAHVKSECNGVNALIQIGTCAPEAGHGCDYTRVIVTFTIDTSKQANIALHLPHAKISVMLDQIEVPVERVIANGVIEFLAPPHEAGIVKLRIIARDERTGNLLTHSNQAPFCYTPGDASGLLNLHEKLLEWYKINRRIAFDPLFCKFRHSVKYIDLSDNQISDVAFLQGFYRLHTLIVDNNNISHDSFFPCLPKLHTLCINRNKIVDIKAFVDKIGAVFPQLQYLSTLNNRCSPMFRDEEEYKAYRLFIIGQLKNLQTLDSQPVTVLERTGNTWSDAMVNSGSPPLFGFTSPNPSKHYEWASNCLL